MICQVQLINKILEDRDYSIISSNNLTDKYFFNYKNEFNFIKNHYEMYNKVPDTLTFCNAFPQFDVVEVSEPTSYLLEQLYFTYNDATLRENFNKMKRLLESGQTDAAMKYYAESLNDLQQGAVMTCTDLITDTSRYDRYLDRTVDHEKFYLTTGFKEIDDIIGGFDRLNENVVIMARPGVGKTQMLLKMATVAAQQGLRVGIFEGEMTEDKIGYRIDTFLGHIENTALNRGDLFINERYKTYIDNLKNSNIGSIKVLTLNDIPSGECTVDTLNTFVEREKLEVLFIDQYDLMTDLKFARTPHEHIANIAEGIKKLQVKKKIPIVAVDQMTREKNEDGTPGTNNAAGSDMISRFATIMFALDQKQKEDGSTELTIYIPKARDGGTGKKIVYNTNFNTGTFEFIPTDTVSKEQSDKLKNKYAVANDGESAF